jgi:hypothetical protein
MLSFFTNRICKINMYNDFVEILKNHNDVNAQEKKYGITALMKGNNNFSF